MIPGGCTGLIQAPDVCWNKPFKQHLKDLYDVWLEHGTHTYTKGGNIRAPTKTDMCDFVVKSWAKISIELIKKSFTCCGQSIDSRPEDITCLKKGSQADEALPQVIEIWDKPSLVSVTNTEEEDEEQLLENELVIESDDELPFI